MLKRLWQRWRWLPALAGYLALLGLTAGLWWWLPPSPRLSGKLPTANPFEVSLSADGQTLLTRDAQGLDLWEFPALRHRANLPLTVSVKVLLAPNGRSVAYDWGDDKPRRFRLWNPDVRPEPFGFVIWCDLQFSQDGQTLIGWTHETCFLINANTGHERPLPEGMEPEARLTVRWDAGRVLAVARGEEVTKVWDLSGAARCLTLPGAEAPIVVSPDGRYLAAKSGKETRLWDAATGRELSTPGCFGPEEDLLPVEFSPDGRFLLLSAHFDVRPIGVWDIATLPPTRVGEFDRYPVVFSPDGRWFAIDGNQSPAQGRRNTLGWEVWTTATARPACFVPFHAVGTWRSTALQFPGLTFAPDGNTVTYRCAVSAGTGPLATWFGYAPVYVVKVADAATGSEIASLPDWDSFLYMPDGKTLATLRLDGTIAFWDLPPLRPWWIDYGLPVVFIFLLLLGAWQCLRMRRRPAGAPAAAS